jgi:hypothetical protein
MITFDKIKNSNPLILVYPGGSGGEFVTQTLSAASESFHALPSTYDASINRIELSSPLRFQYRWPDVNNPETWVDPEFIDTSDDNLRYIIRLHPETTIVQKLGQHLPNAEILYMTPLAECEYFSKLLFLKTAYKLEIPTTPAVIRAEVGPGLNAFQLYRIVNWVNAQSEVWSPELGHLSFLLKDGQDINDVPNDANPYSHIRKYKYSMYQRYYETCQYFEDVFDVVHNINSDSLTTDGIEFWSRIKEIVPNLDLDYAISKTRDWISKNNAIISNFDNENNVQRNKK